MTDDPQLRRMKAALGYWSKVDYLTQDSLPEAKASADINYGNSSKAASVSHTFRYPLDASEGTDIISIVQQDIEAEYRKKIRRLKKKRGEGAELKHLDDAVDRRSFPKPAIIEVYLGIIPREPVISALEEHLSSSAENGVKLPKRHERETDNMAGALLHLSGEGVLQIEGPKGEAGPKEPSASFEISPAISVLRTRGKRGDLHSRIQADQKELKEQIAANFDSLTPITTNDLRKIIDAYIAPALKGRMEAFLKDHPEEDGDANQVDPLHRIIIKYRAFEEEGREASESKLCRSFYTEDIESLRREIGNTDPQGHGQLKLALSYLEGGLDDSAARDGRRLDIQSASDSEETEAVARFYADVLDLDSTPLGRWPSKYSLSLMQQVAVNLVAGRAPSNRVSRPLPHSDIMSVNGPPGTGKTTLLKDIIAANIVEKARLLAAYKTPDDAFEAIPEVETPLIKYAPIAYRLKDPAISDLGIIVCSSNNTAVENISSDLPKGEELLAGLAEDDAGKRERSIFLGTDDPDGLFLVGKPNSKSDKSSGGKYVAAFERDLYFSDIACRQFNGPKREDECEVFDMLISARLGKKENVDGFRYTTLQKIVNGTNKGFRRDYITRFRKTAKAFNEQYARVEKLMRQYAERQHDVSRLYTQVDEALLAQRRAQDDLRRLRSDFDRAQSTLAEAERQAIDRLRRTSGSEGRLDSVGTAEDLMHLSEQLHNDLASYTAQLEHLEKGRVEAKQCNFITRKRKVDNAEKRLTEFREQNIANRKLHRFMSEVDGELAGLDRLACNVRDARCDLDRAEAQAREKDIELAARQIERDRALGSCDWAVTPQITGPLVGSNLNSDDLRKSHLFNPAAKAPEEGTLRFERDKLFLRALQVTRDFILSSDHAATNLRLLNAYWGGLDVPDNKKSRGRISFEDETLRKIAPALFQTLNILTPVISTTFASAGRLFKHVPIANEAHAPLGLCIIDEAGQAIPAAAVGILARCNKALVVGDPYQIEPVVGPEAKLFMKLLGKDIDDRYRDFDSSVQALADSSNPIGHYREGEDGQREWIGCPLIVHRRCVSPMFEISNEISYDNSMLNETPKLDPEKEEDKKKLESFYLPSSQWINVAGHENGNKDHYVAAQGKRAKEIVLAAFAKKRSNERVPSLYIISPFSTVADGMREDLKACRPDGATQKAWDDFLKNNIGTVHKFQGKEAQEVIFMLGCDSSASGAVQWVNPNIVNVAASRAKQRLYVIADCNIWESNPYVSTMKRIIDTAWIDLWNDSLSNGGNGIEEARSAIPRIESLPTCDLSSAEDGTTSHRDADAEQDSALAADSADVAFDTSAFLGNALPRITQLALSESVCKRFGFEDEHALEASFAACADIDNPSSNPILANIKMGMLLYDVFDIEHRDEAGDREDWSFCAIMFCRAAELLLQRDLLPSLKAIEPEMKVAGNRKLIDRTELSLGQYHHALCDKGSIAACGMAAGYRCGGHADTAATAINGTTPQDPAWWDDFGKNLDRLAKARNEFCHAGRNATPDIKKLLARLFDSHIKQEDQGKHVALLCENRTLEIAQEGIESTDFAHTMRKLAGTGPALPVQADNPDALHPKQPKEPIPTDDRAPVIEIANRAPQPHEHNTARETGSRKAVFQKWQTELSSAGKIPASLRIKTQALNSLLIETGYMEKPESGPDKDRPMFTEKAFATWGDDIFNEFSGNFGTHSPKYTLEGFRAVLNFYAACKGIKDRT